LKRWLLLLSLLSMGCAESVYTWPAGGYKPRFRPGDEAGRDSGPIEILVSAYPMTMVSPGGFVTYQVQLRGDLSDCAYVKMWLPNETSGSSDCSRSQRKERRMRCVGSCSTTVAVFGTNGKKLAQGSVTVEVGGED
jgi:hypothetical protein